MKYNTLCDNCFRSPTDDSASSSSDSDSSSDSVKLLQKLQEERIRHAEERRRQKELVKATETPEEKRLRRLLKKEAKERKRKERMGWDNDYLHYTNTDNPFGDGNLLSTFVWSKKLDKEGLTGVSREELEVRNRQKQEENRRELEKVCVHDLHYLSLDVVIGCFCCVRLLRINICHVVQVYYILLIWCVIYTVYPVPTTDLNLNLKGTQFEYQLC